MDVLIIKILNTKHQKYYIVLSTNYKKCFDPKFQSSRTAITYIPDEGKGLFHYCVTEFRAFTQVRACGYVADKIGRLCSGKSKEEEAIKPISERKCVLSNGVGPQNGSGPGVTPVTKNPYPDSPPPSYDSVAT